MSYNIQRKQLQTPLSASYAESASYLIGSVTFNTSSLVTTSSFNAFTSSYTTGSFTGSFRGVFTGSLFGTASNAITASYIPTLRAAGSNNEIQFNSNGNLGSDPAFTWQGSHLYLGVGVGAYIGNINVIGANDIGLFDAAGDGVIAAYDGAGVYHYALSQYKYDNNTDTHKFTGSLQLSGSIIDNLTYSGSFVLFYLEPGPGLTIKTRAYEDVPFADTFRVTTASEVFIKGPVECTGYLTVFTSSTYPDSAIITPTLYVGSYSTATANTAASLHAGPGFVNITGSLRVNNGGITGSLRGTSFVASKVVIDTTPASSHV